MTTENETTLLVIRGVVAGLPAEDQKRVNYVADEFRRALKVYGNAAQLALALVGAEEAAK